MRGRCNQDGAELVWGLVPVHNKEVEGNEEDVRPEVAANQPLAKHRLVTWSTVFCTVLIALHVAHAA